MITDQPKPSEPKSPQPEQRPVQPGQTDDGRSTSANPERPNIQTPDDSRLDRRGERK